MDEPDHEHVFGPFRLDARTLELFRDGRRVPLEPLPARILVRLVEQAGTMVPRGVLRELGWPRLPDAAEQSLNTCIRQIREALGDAAGAPRYVETLRGRGYRFVAAVARPGRARGDGTGRRLVAHRFGLAAGAVALAAALVAAAAVGRLAPSPDASVTRLAGEPSGGVPLETRRRLLAARWLLEQGRDPELALALADSVVAERPGLAEGHGLRAELLLLAGDATGARAAAGRATALDPVDPAGLRAFAGVQMLAGAWAEAEASLGTALEGAPDDAHTLNALAFLLTVRGRTREAGETLRRALQADPLSPVLVGDAGLMHLWAGRWDEAERACRETLRLRPDATWALGCVFDALVQAGRPEAAAREGRAILARFGAGDRIAARAGPDEVLDEVRRWRVEAWEQAVAGGTSPVGLALAYADVGREAEALAALERAAAEPTLAVLTAAVDPRLRPVAGDARYRSVLERFGLSASVPPG